jgi:hypothetical protein
MPIPSEPATQSHNVLHLDRWRARLAGRCIRPSLSERGDIAGWVMITVMTIMLAGAIMAIFTPAVTDYLQSALDQFM